MAHRVGLPVQPNSWEVIFARASQRCKSTGTPTSITPHQLRHTFAVHMLAMLIQHRLRDAALPAGPMEGYRQIFGDPAAGAAASRPCQPTDHLHLSHHIASRADTVDAAVEELLALLPSGDLRRRDGRSRALRSVSRQPITSPPTPSILTRAALQHRSALRRGR